MSIGKIIKEKREKLGLTQNELASKLGVTDRAVSKWEQEKSDPSLQTLPIIADFFNVSLDYLINGKEKEVITNSSNLVTYIQEKISPCTLADKDLVYLRVIETDYSYDFLIQCFDIAFERTTRVYDKGAKKFVNSLLTNYSKVIYSQSKPPLDRKIFSLFKRLESKHSGQEVSLEDFKTLIYKILDNKKILEESEQLTYIEANIEKVINSNFNRDRIIALLVQFTEEEKLLDKPYKALLEIFGTTISRINEDYRNNEMIFVSSVLKTLFEECIKNVSVLKKKVYKKNGEGNNDASDIESLISQTFKKQDVIIVLECLGFLRNVDLNLDSTKLKILFEKKKYLINRTFLIFEDELTLLASKYTKIKENNRDGNWTTIAIPKEYEEEFALVGKGRLFISAGACRLVRAPHEINYAEFLRTKHERVYFLGIRFQDERQVNTVRVKKMFDDSGNFIGIEIKKEDLLEGFYGEEARSKKDTKRCAVADENTNGVLAITSVKYQSVFSKSGKKRASHIGTTIDNEWLVESSSSKDEKGHNSPTYLIKNKNTGEEMYISSRALIDIKKGNTSIEKIKLSRNIGTHSYLGRMRAMKKKRLKGIQPIQNEEED